MGFLSLENAEVGYGQPLIRNINADLELGEVCLMMGDNGTGKTTLIKTILSQLPLLSGKISIDGRDTSELSAQEVAEYIAVVFSKYEIPAFYTTTDLIALGKFIHYPYYIRLSEEDRAEVSKAIHLLGLDEYKYCPLQNLSDGNLQKAFIGRAIVQNSPVILLDEPTTHLDEQNKIALLKLLRRLAKKYHKLILFSSHDWRLAKHFADKIWYISDRNLHSGSVEELIGTVILESNFDDLINGGVF